MVRARPISRLIHRQRNSPSIIQKVHRNRFIPIIRTRQPSRKVRYQINLGPIERRVGVQDTWDGVHVGLRVVTDDGGVDEESEEGVLVRGVVVF